MDILNYLNQFDLDIRKTKNARFMDQKVTPDVLCIVADCIINFIGEDESNNITFTSKDIWGHEYSNANVKELFGKTDLNNKNASNEYDKFFQQPMKTMSYAKILKETKIGARIYFTVIKSEILNYISIKENNSLTFLNVYLEKVLKDSGLWVEFENFFEMNNKDSLVILKKKYEEFIINNTPINGSLEVRRIFTKVLNPLAFKRKLHGVERGQFSSDIISNPQLFYNRKNWRDISKKKGETRGEYDLRNNEEKEVFKQKQKAYVKYSLSKAKGIVRKLHSPTSEIDDEFSNGNATHVHHIFMKSDYPIISSHIENLILLTPTQHYTKAHPNNTQIINRDYQLSCLLHKINSIEIHSNTYSKEDLLFVIKEGLNKEFDPNISYQDLKIELQNIYNQ